MEFMKFCRRLFDSASDSSRMLVHRIRWELIQFEHRITRKVAGGLITLVSIIFFVIAGLYALIEYAKLSHTFSLLIMAAVLLIIGLIVGMSSRRKRYMEEEW